MALYWRVASAVSRAGCLIAVLAAACELDSAGGLPSNAAGSSGMGASAGGVADAGVGGTGAVGGAGVGGVGGGAGGAGAAGAQGGTAGEAAGGAGAAAGSAGTTGTAGAAGSGVIDCQSYPGSQAFTLPTGEQHCYWPVLVPEGFAPAQSVCAQSPGGHLVTLHSPEENQFVQNLAFAVVPSGDRVWIGATDSKAAADTSCSGPTDYGWVTGEPATYTNWSNNSCGCSNGCCEHRGVMGSDGTWRDRCGLIVFPYVCEVG